MELTAAELRQIQRQRDEATREAPNPNSRANDIIALLARLQNTLPSQLTHADALTLMAGVYALRLVSESPALTVKLGAWLRAGERA